MVSKLGVGLIAVGAVFLLAGLIVGLVVQFVVLPQGFINYLKYERDSGFDDPNYEKCENETFSATLFNMTNYQQLMNGETLVPEYEQVGPYNYTRRTCVFQETDDGTHRFYRQYWDPYYQTNKEENDEDVLVSNFNPAYVGVVTQVERDVPNDPEGALMTNFVGPALTQIIEGLQSDAFLDQVKVGGIPQALNLIANEVSGLVGLQLRSGVLYQFFNNEQSDIQGLFNSEDNPFSLINFNNISLELLEGQIDDLLFGSENFPGWTTVNEEPGDGILYFLSQLEAETPATTFGLDPFEFQVVGGWLYNVLLFQFADTLTPGINATARDQLYNQWTSASLFPDGLNFYGEGVDGGEPGNYSFEVNFLNPSNISLESARLLWDSQNSLSFVNSDGIAYWFFAGSQAGQGNFTEFGVLAAEFDLTVSEVGMIFTWLNFWRENTIGGLLVQQFEVQSLDDLAYLQWGTLGVLGVSVSLLDSDSFPVAPEFAAFTSGSLTFTVQESRELLNGTNGFFQPGKVGEFLGLLGAGNLESIEDIWGLDASQAAAFGGYFQFFIGNFVINGLFRGSILPGGGGPITTRTPREWFFEGVDPLLQTVGRSPQVGIYFDEDEPLSREAALNFRLFNETLWNGGSKDEFANFLEKKTFEGLPTVPAYGDTPVDGNRLGTQFVPGLDPEAPLFVWSDSVARSASLSKTGEFEVEGITLWRYSFDPSFWAAKEEYNQFVAGVLNVTAIRSFRAFLTRPNFYGVEESFYEASEADLDPTNEYFSNYEIGVEPRSGLTMMKKLLPQVVFGVPRLSLFYNVSAGNYPIMWENDFEQIGAEDADEFKSTVKLAETTYICAYAIGIGLGVILIVAGVIVIVMANKKTGGDSSDASEDVPMEPINNKKDSSGESSSAAESESKDESGSSDSE